MLYFLQQLLNGLHSGALYALLAFGYVLTNGVLKRTNLAYGPIFAFAGQVLIIIAVFGWNVLWLTLPATVALGILLAFLYAALTASLLARSVYIPLALSSPNAIVVATLGVAIVLMELARIAADTRDLWLPPILAAPVMFLPSGRFPVTLTVIRSSMRAGRRRDRAGRFCAVAFAIRSVAGGGAIPRRRCAASTCAAQAAVVGGALLAALAGRWRRFITAISASAAAWSTG